MLITSVPIRSHASVPPLKLADRLSDTQKARAVETLVEKYGSRRALIEELDRRKRLALLNPDKRLNSKANSPRGKTPKVKNEPNPQWREISTPSLLIEGERASDFIPSAFPTLSEEEIAEMKRVYSKSNAQNCKECSIEIADYTPKCRTCIRRKYARKRAAIIKAQREGFIK